MCTLFDAGRAIPFKRHGQRGILTLTFPQTRKEEEEGNWMPLEQKWKKVRGIPVENPLHSRLGKHQAKKTCIKSAPGPVMTMWSWLGNG